MKKFMEEGERGSALVQSAILFPIVLILLFGFILLVPAIRTGAILQMAAREAARTYALTDDADLAAAKAESELRLGMIDPAKTTVTLSRDGNVRGARIVMDFPLTIPFLQERGYKPNGNAVFRLEEYH